MIIYPIVNNEPKLETRIAGCWNLMFRVSQGLLLGQHLFNIFLADLVFVLKDVDILPMTINNDKLNEISRKSLEYSFSFVKGQFFLRQPREVSLIVSTNKKTVNVGEFNI